MKRKSMEYKVLAGFGAALATLLLVIGLSYYTVDHTLKNAALAAHTNEVIATTESLRSQIFDLEATQRAFFLHGTNNFLTLQKNVAAGFQPLLKKLEELVADNGDHLQRIPALREQIAARLSLFEERRRIRDTQGPAALQATAGAGLKITARYLAILDDIRKEELRLLEVRDAATARYARLINTSFIAIAVMLCVILPMLFMRIRHDILSRERAETRLRESEERFRMLVSGTKDYALYMLDNEGRVASWNAGAQRLTGYRDDEIVGQHFRRFYQPEDVANRKPEHELTVAAREGRYEDEGWRVRKDGSRFWANVVITALRDDAGNLRGFGKLTRDITERQEAEKRMRESEERLRQLINNVKDYAIFVLDPTGRVTSWNAGAALIKGYRSEEIIGQHFSRFYPPEDIADGKPGYGLEFAAREGRYEDEGWRVRKDGSRFWANVVITALRDEAGNLRGFGKLTRDMTERRLAEKKLRETNAFLDSVVENLPNMVFVKDARELRFVRFNKAGEELLGFAKTDLLGKNDYDFFPKQEADFFTSKDREVLHDRKMLDIPEETIHTRERGQRTLHTKKIPILNDANEPIYLLGISEDITERKFAEQVIAQNALREETHGRALALFNSTHDRNQILNGVLELLQDNHPFPVSAVYLYDEWSNLLQLATSAGPSARFVLQLPVEDSVVACAVKEKRSCTITGKGITDILKHATAHAQPSALFAVPIFHLNHCLGVLVVGTKTELADSDRMFLERLCVQLGVALNNIRQYTDMRLMAEQLRVRSEEIGDKNRQLEEANRMKSEFLANMSHELRTPLNAIIGFSELLRDGLLGELNDNQKEHITDIFTSGQHLLSLINDILDLSKIEAGYMELDLEAVNVDTLLRGSLAVVKERAIAQRITLTLDAAPDIGTVALDARRVKQIVYNLLSNAVKFTPTGGTVSVTARRTSVPMPEAPEHLPPGEYFTIDVADNGIGISDQDQNRLFKPFTQIDSSLSRRYQGTGLGLVMVKHLAELHGGIVTFESKPDHGSTFHVWLPYRTLAESRPTPLSTILPERNAGAGAPLALIIEDDDTAAGIEQLYLEQEGFRTVRVATAEAGLTAAAEKRPDVIILDVLLPRMDGWEFLSHIKATTELAHIPVVIVSIAADTKRGFSLGATSVLQKPITRDDLLTALRALGLNGRAPAQHQNLNVMVVDDDPKAVDLIATHLEAAQYRVWRVYGGREAIETIKRTPPHLLILDLMMPEISGFDVVREIKGNGHTANIPILVLTSKVITPDDKRFLDGDIMRVVEKGEFNASDFLLEVRRALSPRANAIRASHESTA